MHLLADPARMLKRARTLPKVKHFVSPRTCTVLRCSKGVGADMAAAFAELTAADGDTVCGGIRASGSEACAGVAPFSEGRGRGSVCGVVEAPAWRRLSARSFSIACGIPSTLFQLTVGREKVARTRLAVEILAM